MKRIKRIVRELPFLYRIFVALKHVHYRALGLRHPIQSAGTNPDYQLTSLGSKHCGWTFVEHSTLANSIILSAGLGEDGSFDVEFAAKYNATVHIVDPTPRAIDHFRALIARAGLPPETEYSDSGTQSPESYDLCNVAADQIQLHEVAIWNERTKVKFYLPRSVNHVSHSIVNFQNGYAKDTPFIEVDALPMTALLKKIGVKADHIALLKLDIEGAEIEVIESMLFEGITPKQILVEFDEFNAPTRHGLARISRTHALLLDHGYKIVHTDGQADFLYFKERFHA
ncbi:FkbM family methyltransferase [Sulfitobacter sp. 1A12057]|uniref:FkbM family methyltransferase n=1 Tax=Sulfitobacter sp. 1A12057 TaxID=3368567 RepID=UPI0037451125